MVGGMDMYGMKIARVGIDFSIVRLWLNCDASILLINIIKNLNQILELSLKNLSLNKRFVLSGGEYIERTIDWGFLWWYAENHKALCQVG